MRFANKLYRAGRILYDDKYFTDGCIILPLSFLRESVRQNIIKQGKVGDINYYLKLCEPPKDAKFKIFKPRLYIDININKLTAYIDDTNGIVAFDKVYYDFIISKKCHIEYYAPYDPALIVNQRGKTVGYIMPVRIPSLEGTAELNKEVV